MNREGQCPSPTVMDHPFCIFHFAFCIKMAGDSRAPYDLGVGSSRATTPTNGESMVRFFCGRQVAAPTFCGRRLPPLHFAGGGCRPYILHSKRRETPPFVLYYVKYAAAFWLPGKWRMQRAIKTENISDRRNRKIPDFPATAQSPGTLRERSKTVHQAYCKQSECKWQIAQLIIHPFRCPFS